MMKEFQRKLMKVPFDSFMQNFYVFCYEMINNIQMMRKTNERFNSSEIKKGVTVIKCFICNQMFYAQNTFDLHMKQHSNKLSRNTPE